MHVWALRLSLLCANLLFCSIPALLAQHLVLPRIAALTSSLWPYQAGMLAIAVASSVFGALCAAFCTVYDTQLYRLCTPYPDSLVRQNINRRLAVLRSVPVNE